MVKATFTVHDSRHGIIGVPPQTTGTTDVSTTAAVDRLDAASQTSLTGGTSSAQPPYKKRDPAPICPEFDVFLGWKARQLSHAAPFQPADVDDLHQELRTVWLANRFRFNPCEGSERSFFKTIIERAAAKLRAAALASKRFPPTQVSWNDRSVEPGRDCRRCMQGQSQLTHEERSDLRIEVGLRIRAMPFPLSEICELLMGRTPAEISHEMGIPRSTVDSRITSIRRRFESEKLRDFL